MGTPIKNHLSDERIKQIKEYADSFKQFHNISEKTLSLMIGLLIDELNRYRFKETQDE